MRAQSTTDVIAHEDSEYEWIQAACILTSQKDAFSISLRLWRKMILGIMLHSY